MRKSNLLITKGSVIFAKFEANTKDAYLNDRPLVVVSNPTNILNSITVCTCGTREKPGILASFWNYERNTYIGGNEVSNIYPYMLLTIRIEAIKCCIGQLDPYVMHAIDKAIDYHLGRTTELPPYLNPVYEEVQYVGYNNINTRDFTKNEIISEELRGSYTEKWTKGIVQAPQIKVKDTIKKNKKKKSKDLSKKKKDKEIEKIIGDRRLHEALMSNRINLNKNENYDNFKFSDYDNFSFCDGPETKKDKTPSEFSTKKIIQAFGLEDEYSISDEEYNKIISINKPAIEFWLKKDVLFPIDPDTIAEPKAIVKLIGPVATTCILARTIPISKICKKYSLSVKDATLMRVNLTNFFINKEVSRRNNDESSEEKSTAVIMGTILAKTFIFDELLTKKERAFKEAYNLDTSDGRKWRSVREYYTNNRKLFIK